MIYKRIKSLIDMIIISSLLLSTFACSKKVEQDNYENFWYGCNSLRIDPMDGYNQTVCSNLYSEGYYYFTIYNQKIDEKKEGPDSYYYLYKVNSDGTDVNKITLPAKCVNNCHQAIVNEMLYCVEPNSNTEYIIDINNGNILSEVQPAETTIGFYSLDDGYLKITTENVFCYNKEGLESGIIDLGGMCNISSFYQSDNKYYVIEDNYNRKVFYELNFTNGRLMKVFEIDAMELYSFEISDDVFFSDKGVYYIDINSSLLIPVTEWNYVDVKPAYKTTSYELNISYGDHRFGKVYVYTDNEIEIVIFNNIPSDIYSNRKTITIGGYGVNSSLAVKWAVYKFNTSQKEYRIYTDDYWSEYSYSTGLEAQAQIVKLIKFFNEGNAPDIYYGTNFDYRYMYNAGLVVDMLPIIEKDSSFTLDDLVPSIKDTITREGNCYQIFSAFYFDGDFGRKSVFGNIDITYSEVDSIAQSNDISVRGDMPAAEFADQILRYSLGDLIENSSDNHIVSTEELKDIVEYSVRNGIPYGSYSNNIANFDTVHDGTCLTCRRTYLGNLYDLASIESRLNDSFVYLGFPSIYGSVHAAQPDGLVAISSDTNCQDACWQFIKYMLSDEVQKIEIGQGNNPVINRVFEDFCQYAMDPNLVPETEVIWSSIVNKKKAVPEWIIEDYISMVFSIDIVISYDWGVYNIICDEINSYYLQDKSIDAIAESLQSRLDLYVSENYR